MSIAGNAGAQTAAEDIRKVCEEWREIVRIRCLVDPTTVSEVLDAIEHRCDEIISSAKEGWY